MKSGTEAQKDCIFSNLPDSVQEIYNKIRSFEPNITNILSEVATTTNGYLTGLEYSVKTASSIEEKIHKKEKILGEIGINNNPVDILKTFSDILRYTEILPAEKLAETIPKLLDELEKNGFHVVEIDNKFDHPIEDTHYKGLHIGLVSPFSQQVEFQVHTKESFDTKMACHNDYEISRDTTGKYSELEKEDAKQRMMEKYDAVPDVPDIDQILDIKTSKEYILEMCDKLEKEHDILNEDPYEKEQEIKDFIEDDKEKIKNDTDFDNDVEYSYNDVEYSYDDVEYSFDDIEYTHDNVKYSSDDIDNEDSYLKDV